MNSITLKGAVFEVEENGAIGIFISGISTVLGRGEIERLRDWLGREEVSPDVLTDGLDANERAVWIAVWSIAYKSYYPESGAPGFRGHCAKLAIDQADDAVTALRAARVK